MELSLSGNSLKTFARCITCLARIGHELAIEASPSQLAFHALNSSRSAYQAITFKPHFFDVYTIIAAQVRCSVLLKAVCSVLRTPVASVDHLSIRLPNSDASKVQWTLDCLNGVRKAYWITCNIEPDIQHLSLDRRRFPSNFVVRPRDFNRLLANFQSSLQEITIIATDPTSLPSDAASEIGGKAVELRSYTDPTREESDAALHTQLWIDPIEEFLQYTHSGDPVDVTFAVKELKAFLTFCEGCEVDIHLFFEKAGEPILMAPKFGLDDGSNSDFDATLFLATMLASQLHEGNLSENPPLATNSHCQADQGTGSQARRERFRVATSEHPSDHTKIWSELSGSAKSGNGAEERHVQVEMNSNASGLVGRGRANAVDNSNIGSAIRNMPDGPDLRHPVVINHEEEPQDRAEMNNPSWSQHHRSNWVGTGDDDDEEDEDELLVQPTPPC
ncbi:cell cycle checkpoint control protein RAD9A isoform X1 [Macadamia integrifolia]|uniref:cell cycle checkpoint control protein RAD9A isoform X1 n=1 Tax=Macadamia integrifolia TaxID=60698 RepID=UPI001C5319ED|nr:cell cycle checkpoint control protein RAD9A isoform X1 [Macadamia integrifolia]